uniref:Uncharacterized protein n=1 Tax=Odontella aurita TaxID=265563 RepID=A0A7S4J683_9STRA
MIHPGLPCTIRSVWADSMEQMWAMEWVRMSDWPWGLAVGVTVVEDVGLTVGAAVSVDGQGDTVSRGMDGATVGSPVEPTKGWTVGLPLGLDEGAEVGLDDGEVKGMLLGLRLG